MYMENITTKETRIGKYRRNGTDSLIDDVFDDFVITRQCNPLCSLKKYIALSKESRTVLDRSRFVPIGVAKSARGSRSTTK